MYTLTHAKIACPAVILCIDKSVDDMMQATAADRSQVTSTCPDFDSLGQDSLDSVRTRQLKDDVVDNQRSCYKEKVWYLQQGLDMLYELCNTVLVTTGIDWMVPNHNAPTMIVTLSLQP